MRRSATTTSTPWLVSAWAKKAAMPSAPRPEPACRVAGVLAHGADRDRHELGQGCGVPDIEPSSMARQVNAGTEQNWTGPPFRWRLTVLYLAQRLVPGPARVALPAPDARARDHQLPSESPGTSLPTATTVLAISWPGSMGPDARSPGGAWAWGRASGPNTCSAASVPQIPVAWVRRTTSPSAGPGSGTSSIRRSWSASKTDASIARSQPLPGPWRGLGLRAISFALCRATLAMGVTSITLPGAAGGRFRRVAGPPDRP